MNTPFPQPNPDVYLMAAMLLEAGHLTRYTSSAIPLAAGALGCSDVATDAHTQMFALMFGAFTKPNNEPLEVTLYEYPHSSWQRPTIAHNGVYAPQERIEGPLEGKAKDEAVLALLLMAAIVENPA